jgi:glycosyltransferase involved in cell wall biosynthesis
MIDVLIPAYNAEKTIAASVRSILAQSLPDLRVFVVDDGSTDRTGLLLKKMAKDDSRLFVITTENRGIVDALNVGLSHCNARLVARLDADDIAYPDRFLVQKSYMDANPDCVAVGGSVWHVDEIGRKLGTIRYSGDAVGDARRIPAGEPYLMHSFLMVRHSALSAVGGYRHVFHSEDTDLYWRLKPLGRLHNLKDILGEVRVHGGSVTSRSIVNGRVGAVSSQLSALSFLRRSRGQQDILFPRSMLKSFEEVGSLEGMLTLASNKLSLEERRYLYAASAFKLLELRAYRKFKLTWEDILFISSVFKDNWQTLDLDTSARLVRQVGHLARPKFGLRRIGVKVQERYKSLIAKK